jgi:hypothetical protein
MVVVGVKLVASQFSSFGEKKSYDPISRRTSDATLSRQPQHDQFERAMFYDLFVPWSSDRAELQKIIYFLAERESIFKLCC